MAARSRWTVVSVSALVVGYLGLIVLGAYVVGGAVLDSMRAQQTADVVATLPHQELVMVTIAQERALATVAERSCAAGSPDCATAEQAWTALLDGTPEQEQDGGGDAGSDAEPDADADGVPSAVQQTITALEQRDRLLGALDVGQLDPQVRAAVGQMLDERAVVDQIHDTVEGAPGEAIEAYDRYLLSTARVSEALAGSVDGELRAHLEAELLLVELTLGNFQERPLVSLALGAHEVGQPGYLEPAAAQVAAVDQQAAQAQDALDRTGSDQRVPPLDGALALVRSAVSGGDLTGVTPAQAEAFATESARWADELWPVREAVRTEALELAQDEADAATQQALLTGGVAGGVLLLGLVVVIVVAVLLLRGRRKPAAPPSTGQQPHATARTTARHMAER